MFGMCTTSRNVRFILVPDRQANTLIPLINSRVVEGSKIWSDKWPAYNGLTDEGFHHETVNHKEHFVDPVTGSNTKTTERCWKEGNAWLHRVRRPSHLLQSHLDEIAWRLNNKDSENGLLMSYLRDVKKYYSEMPPAAAPNEEDQE